MSKKEQILKRIVDVVEQKVPNSEIYLFGSQARGTAQKFSDWDVLILLNTQSVSFDFETNFMNDFYDIELETGIIISPLIYTLNDWNSNHSITPLFSNIKREGVRLK